jgi:hypothetical protein
VIANLVSEFCIILLSLQEIRQAGSTAEIASLVRRISAAIRGDASLTDYVKLEDMPKISITNDPNSRGIYASDIFWVQQGILSREAVRESRDEELVLDILLDLILKPMASSGSLGSNGGRDTGLTWGDGDQSGRGQADPHRRRASAEERKRRGSTAQPEHPQTATLAATATEYPPTATMPTTPPFVATLTDAVLTTLSGHHQEAATPATPPAPATLTVSPRKNPRSKPVSRPPLETAHHSWFFAVFSGLLSVRSCRRVWGW